MRFCFQSVRPSLLVRFSLVACILLPSLRSHQRMPERLPIGVPVSAAIQASAETVLLADNFDINSIDTSKWQTNSLFSGFTDSSVGVADTSQQLQIGPLKQNAGGSHYNGLRSAATFNFSGAYCYIEIVSPPSASTAADAMLTVGSDVNDFYRMYLESGNLTIQRKAGGAKAVLVSQAY